MHLRELPELFRSVGSVGVWESWSGGVSRQIRAEGREILTDRRIDWLGARCLNLPDVESQWTAALPPGMGNPAKSSMHGSPLPFRQVRQAMPDGEVA